jgi:hypothetical protein
MTASSQKSPLAQNFSIVSTKLYKPSFGGSRGDRRRTELSPGPRGRPNREIRIRNIPGRLTNGQSHLSRPRRELHGAGEEGENKRRIHDANCKESVPTPTPFGGAHQHQPTRGLDGAQRNRLPKPVQGPSTWHQELAKDSRSAPSEKESPPQIGTSLHQVPHDGEMHTRVPTGTRTGEELVPTRVQPS